MADYDVFTNVAVLREVYSIGTRQSIASGAWYTRVLNTSSDPNNIAPLSSNQFTLQPGWYFIRGQSPGINLARWRIALYDVTHSQFSLLGTSAYGYYTTDLPGADISNSYICGVLYVTEPTIFEVRGHCRESAGYFGVNNNFDLNVQQHITIAKLPAQPLITVIQDEKASIVSGGTSTAGAWYTRVLNTIQHDGIGITLNNNVMTIPAGVYYVGGYCPHQSSSVRHRLHNITDDVTCALSDTTFSDIRPFSASVYPRRDTVGCSFNDIMILPGTKDVQLQYWCNIGESGVGLGYYSNSGENEVYSQLYLIKFIE